MNDDNLSNIPVSELVKRVDPAKLQAELEKNKPADKTKKSNKKVFIILGAIILAIGIGVALYFILKQPAAPAPEEEKQEEVDIVWEPDEDSTDAAGDFITHQQTTIDNPDATTSEKVQAQIEIVNLYSVMGQFEDGLAILDSINREGLAYSDLFALYSSYAYLYEHSGDEEKRLEYDAKVNELFNTRWDDGSDQQQPTTNEENPGNE